MKDDYYFTFYNDKNSANPPETTNNPDIKTPEVTYVKPQRKITIDYTPDNTLIKSSNSTYQTS